MGRREILIGDYGPIITGMINSIQKLLQSLPYVVIVRS